MSEDLDKDWTAGHDARVDDPSGGARVRIGELGRRSGVRPELLRAWERRYGLLSPERSAGGFRLYGPADEERVRTMRRNLARGYSAAVAARMALQEMPPRHRALQPAWLSDAARDLAVALDEFSDGDAQTVLDRLFATFSVESVLREVIVPYVRELGERAERGEISLGQEHFAAAVVRGRLLGLARGWGFGGGARAILACPPAEHNDLGLLCFGIGLRERGWRVTYLGPDTPVRTLLETADTLDPDLIVVGAASPAPLEAVADDLRDLARLRRVALAGAGASTVLAGLTGLDLLEEAPPALAARAAVGV